MGTSTQTNIRACKIQGHGEPLYVVYITSIDNNIEPRYESECAMVAGSFDYCVKKAVLFASSIPGGSTKGYSVTGYVSAWIDALVNPYCLEREELEVRIQKDNDFSFFDLSDDNIAEVFPEEMAKKLINGEELFFDALANINLIENIGRRMPPWKYLPGGLSKSPSGAKESFSLESVSTIHCEGAGSSFLTELQSGQIKTVKGFYFVEELFGNHKCVANSEYSLRSVFLTEYDFTTFAQFKRDWTLLGKLIAGSQTYTDCRIEVTGKEGLSNQWELDFYDKHAGMPLDASKLHSGVRVFLNGFNATVTFRATDLVTNDNPEWVQYSHVKEKIKKGQVVETKNPIEFSDDTKSKRFRKSSLPGKKNVWFDLENNCYVRITGGLGLVKLCA